jgi:hypothetical protein
MPAPLSLARGAWANSPTSWSGKDQSTNSPPLETL